MQLIDTHAHLDDPGLPDLADVLARARAAGVVAVVAIATTAESSAVGLRLAEHHPHVHPTIGIHPNQAAEAAAGDWDRIVELSGRQGVVALGETGLDRHWDRTPWDIQMDYFDRHLQLSRRTGLPVVIHMRECAAEMLEVLRADAQKGLLNGVLHSFTGDAAMAQEAIGMGLYIGFAGMLTFKKSGALREVAAALPADRILVETDSPYLSPEPLRGKTNEPANVVHTARVLAEARGVALDDLAAQTTASARRLFRIRR